MQAIAKKNGMIKGIIRYKVLDYKKVKPILMQLRSRAMQCPGFITDESMVSEGDESVGVLISQWETLENWKTWVGSKGTETLLRRARTSAMGAPTITAYRTMPTVQWS